MAEMGMPAPGCTTTGIDMSKKPVVLAGTVLEFPGVNEANARGLNSERSTDARIAEKRIEDDWADELVPCLYDTTTCTPDWQLG